MQTTQKISFIGAGNMTSAIIKGLINKGFSAANIMATNPSRPKLDELASSCAIKTSTDNQEALEFADTVVLAVKPQMMQTMCKELFFPLPNKPINNSSKNSAMKVFVSIAAGLGIDKLRKFLPGHQKIVRVMPNTPSSIGMGMSGIFADKSVSANELSFVVDIMNSIGKTQVLQNEDDINTVIAAAGSSPAYFFLIAEAMQNAAVDMGINAKQARQLVVQAMLGSAALMEANENLELSELRAQVTSKGGTTAKAIESLQENNLENIFASAMQAAVSRAKQMSEQL